MGLTDGITPRKHERFYTRDTAAGVAQLIAVGVFIWFVREHGRATFDAAADLAPWVLGWTVAIVIGLGLAATAIAAVVAIWKAALR